MISLQDVLIEQNNLDSLCKDRDLVSNDPFQPNMYYGMSKVIKEYANLSIHSKPKWIIPHGIVFSEKHIWEEESKAHLPIIFSYPEYRDNTYKVNTDKVVIPSASPFSYLAKLMENTKPINKKGLIFFPTHSTHHIQSSVDYYQLAEKLSNFKGTIDPINVCIYWKDFLLGNHKPFQQMGFNIISAGHIYDPNFLYRLYHLCSIHEYSASNYLGSAIFYSIRSGCKFFFIGYEKPKYVGDINQITKDIPEIPNKISSKVLDSLISNEGYPSNNQQQIVEYFLREEKLMSQKEIRKLYLCSQLLDIFNFKKINNIRKISSISPFIARLVCKK